MCKPNPLHSLGLVLYYFHRTHSIPLLWDFFYLLTQHMFIDHEVKLWAVGYRARENFHSNKWGWRNILVNICWRLCKSFPERLDCWSLGVTESNTPNIPLAPPKPHPFTSLSLWSGRTTCLWPGQWNGGGRVVWCFQLEILKLTWESPLPLPLHQQLRRLLQPLSNSAYVAQKPCRSVVLVSYGRPTLMSGTDLWGLLLGRIISPA